MAATTSRIGVRSCLNTSFIVGEFPETKFKHTESVSADKDAAITTIFCIGTVIQLKEKKCSGMVIQLKRNLINRKVNTKLKVSMESHYMRQFKHTFWVVYDATFSGEGSDRGVIDPLPFRIEPCQKKCLRA